MGGIVTRSGKPAPQDPVEFEAFLDLVRKLKVKRYLEIGCRHGDTFYAVMKAAEPDAFGLAVDLPSLVSSENILRECVKELRAHLIIGNSHSRDVIERVWDYSPFDFILIDGDHTYEGVEADWEHYSDLAPVVALHDIAAPMYSTSLNQEIGVPEFWDQLKVNYHHEEIVNPGSKMGFGIIYKGA